MKANLNVHGECKQNLLTNQHSGYKSIENGKQRREDVIFLKRCNGYGSNCNKSSGNSLTVTPTQMHKAGTRPSKYVRVRKVSKMLAGKMKTLHVLQVNFSKTYY